MPRASLPLACALALAACNKPSTSVTPEPETPRSEPETDADPEASEDPDPAASVDPEVEAPPDSSDEDLDAATRQALAQTIRGYLADLQSCYEAELHDDTSLAGKMTYTITVQPGGTVSDVVIELDEVGSDVVRGCVVTEIEAWTFADTALDEEADVTFSVNFTAV